MLYVCQNITDILLIDLFIHNQINQYFMLLNKKTEI